MVNYFMPLIRKDMLNTIKTHKKQGHKIILLSGMFTEFLDVVGQKLGADYVIGTRMKKNGKKYSGKIVKPLCFGENKAYLLKEFIHRKKIQVDLSRSYAYADSIYDLPVFQMVGNPIATYPDKKLLKIACDNNWEIIGNANTSPGH